MSAVLDPVSQNFVNASSKDPPLHEKTYPEARELLETQQQHEACPDIKEYTIDVPFDTRTVSAVLFRSNLVKGHVPVILYTHEGGWIRGRSPVGSPATNRGSPNIYGSLMEDLARQTGAAVVFPQYTAAPEGQYPMQFEESYAVLRHVVEQGARLHLKSDNVALAGDSASGHMAIAMVQLAQQRRLPVQISHLTLFYPVTDTHEKSSTYQAFRDGPYITERTLDWIVDAFLPNPQDRCNALTSPLSFASDRQLSVFPPTTLFVSGSDPLIGEGKRLGTACRRPG